MIKHTALAAGLALASSLAIAGTDHATTAEQVRDWQKMDTNADHLISPQEMMDYMSAYWAAQGKSAKHPAAAGEPQAAGDLRDWQAMDTNGDSLISPDEMKAYMAIRQAQKQAALSN